MTLADVLKEGTVVAHLKGEDMREVLDELCTSMSLAVDAIDKEPLLEAVLEREKLGSTAVGMGVAVPHAKLGCVDTVYVAFGKCANGVDFHAIDGETSNLIFLIVAPIDSTEEHLKVLSNISNLVKDESFRAKLLSAKSAEEIIDIIKSTESALENKKAS